MSEARVFNYKDSGLGAFIRGTGGLVAVNQDAFANSAGTATVLDDAASSYDYSGEVGFILSITQGVHIRLGAEVLQPVSVNTIGADAAGTQRYSLNSSVFVFNPNLVFETVYSTSGSMRFFAEFGVGYATVNVTNDYKMTAAGTSALGVSDFKETFSGTALSGMAAFAFEALFNDNVTFSLDAGYRYLPVTSFKYTSDVNNLVKPTGVASGDPVLNTDGSDRTMNLSGFFAGVSFRFYLNFL